MFPVDPATASLLRALFFHSIICFHRLLTALTAGDAELGSDEEGGELPGWGSWAGPGIKPSRKIIQRKKRALERKKEVR